MMRSMALVRGRRTVLALAGILLTASPALIGRSLADDTPEERTTLKGIKALKVGVRDLHPDAEADGLTAGQLPAMWSCGCGRLA